MPGQIKYTKDKLISIDNAKESTLFEIKNLESASADLYFYGDIVSSYWSAWDESDQYPEAVRDFLKEVDSKDLKIYINSGGGSVFAGMAIYNMLKRHKGKKTVYVDGLAASIASIIAFAGDEIIIPSNAFLMIHKPWSWTAGNSEELRKLADDLDVLETGLINVYQENIKEGIDIEEIKQMVQEETWLNGEEASKYFNVTVTQENQVVACVSDLFARYKKLPEMLNQVQEKEEEQPLDDETNNEDMELAVAKLKLQCA